MINKATLIALSLLTLPFYFGHANADRVSFFPFTLDPRLEYRAYVVSGMKAPEEGWVVRDGGWVMLINDPAGVELGGDFTGMTVPAGTMFFYGEYNIKTRKKKDNIVISYRSGSPVITNQAGLLPFGCEVAIQPITANFPNGTEGLAQGFGTALIPDGNGFLQANVRNTLTFNDQGGI